MKPLSPALSPLCGERERCEPPARIGIIGCGNVLSAYRLALEKLRARGWADVIVACGREGQRATTCTELAVDHFTTDEKEVLNSPEVDVVVILTSMSQHGRLARAALEAGKHVLVEKPLATTLEEAAALVELAKKTSR